MLRPSLLVVSLFLTGAAQPQSWAEALFADKFKYFGSVQHCTVLAHPVRLHNTSGQTLHVARLRVSCGCVVAEMDTSELAPVQETNVLAKMHTDRFHGDKTVTIFVT